MRVDNFLASYNANSSLLETVAKNSTSLNSAKNLARAEFEARTNTNSKEFDQALKEQTDAFEAFFIKSILDISLKNKASIFKDDASDKIYSSMYNDAMSKALSGGMGFSELLFNFLKEGS
ncbi:hypothetical protein [Campylobacter troglodytis]|uniref:hypothetical protein n=1 Tax=Campylobacter troglodytis TaxID=654363 RepID=UPI001157012F|nr:hypothetical protein [Campylobacter troglodytis]TQR57309.1 hypothetical protein DMC01_08530 [Campylobacter troglodytis]